MVPEPIQDRQIDKHDSSPSYYVWGTLESCKFSTSGFWRIYTFWGLENPKNTKLIGRSGDRWLVC